MAQQQPRRPPPTAIRRAHQLHRRLSRLAALRILRSQKGVALLIALFAMVLMTFIAVEVSYDTSVDYVVAAQQVNRIKAYYAAKSGVELSLLRIMLYKQAMAAMGDTLGNNKSMLDPIWSFPFMWPPTAAGAGAKTTEVDKDMLKEAIGESLMQGQQFATTITPEGGKIDINDLGSDIKTLRQAMITQVLKIFQAEIKNNEEFAKKYSGFRFEELVNNIADYVDEDKESLNGGDESNAYRDIEEKDIQMPPNRPFRTLDELHQVAGMKDDFFNVLAPKVTVFGVKGVNINYAALDVLMALDPTMTEEAAQKVIGRRTNPKLGGPFKDPQDFFAFIQPFGVNAKNIENSKVLLWFDIEFNFRVISTGFASNVRREITAITYDYENLTPRFAELLSEQEKQALGPGGIGAVSVAAGSGDQAKDAAAAAAAKKSKIQGGKGRPTVVYWEEN